MYNDMRTNEKFGSIEATEQAKIAKEQAEIATDKAAQIVNTLSDLQKEGKSVTDGISEIQDCLTDVKKYLETIKNARQDIVDSVQVATNQANVAKSKASAASTSEVNAKASEVAAKTSEENAKSSETAAKDSENKAKVSEENAKTSENNAKTSASNALQSEKNALDWAEGTPADTTSEDGTVVKHYSSKYHAEQAAISADKAKLSEGNAATSEKNSRQSEENARQYESAADNYMKNAENSAGNAAKSEGKAKSSEENAANSESMARIWAESDKDIEVETTLEDGSKTTEKHKSAKSYAEEASKSADNAATSFANMQEHEAKTKEYMENARDYTKNVTLSETTAREFADKAGEAEKKARLWAESLDVVETTAETVTETVTEDGELKEVEKEIQTDHYSAKHYATEASDTYSKALEFEERIKTYADTAKAHKDEAGASESKAKVSEDNAKLSETNAKESENASKTSETNAKESETNAAKSADTARLWAMAADSPDGQFDEDSKNGKTQSSKTWAIESKAQAIEATRQKNEVSDYIEQIKTALKQASDLKSSIDSIQNAIKALNDEANSVLEESKRIRDTISNAVSYQGSVKTYADLPAADSALHIGFMYNIQEADKEHEIKAGDNVVWNGVDWDNMGGFIDVDDILNGGKNATFGDVKADSFTGKLIGNADTATTADSAKSVDWSNVQNKPTTMTAEGGTADRALKADVCTGNAASASSVAWGNVTGKPSLMGTGGGSFTGNVTAPQFYTPNWFRAQANGGIYWEKWGGGWFMQDSTWVRAYNGKSIYSPAQILAEGNITSNHGILCKAIDASIWGGWNKCIQFQNGSHAAIYNSAGGSFIGIHSNKNIYFGNHVDKKYYAEIHPDGFHGNATLENLTVTKSLTVVGGKIWIQ